MKYSIEKRIENTMIITSLGLPGLFADWGFQVVRHVALAARPGSRQYWINGSDPFEYDRGADAIVYSRFPPRPLREMLLSRDSPIIVFTTTAFEAVSYQRQFHKPALLDGVRDVSASIAQIADCHPQKRALFVDSASARSAETVVGMIADYLGYSVPPGFVGALLETIGPMPVPVLPTFTEAEEGIVTLVLESSLAHLRDAKAPLKSIWPHRVFLAGDRPSEEAPLVAEATGGSRILFYGPYFHLAEGRWRVKLTLGFTKEAIGLPLKIWVQGPNPLGEVRLRPRQEGIFAAQFNFTVAEPEYPVEIQIWTAEGAIEGRIALGQAELTHLGREQATK